MTITEQQLQQLGLGKNESLVYLALFEIGRAKAGEIIAHTGLHRNLVYTALEKLVKDNLVAKFIKNDVAIFEANNPKMLLDKLENQKEIAKEVIANLRIKQIAVPHEVKVYEGHEGIIEARKVVKNLKAGDTGYAFGGSELMYSEDLSKEWKPHSAKRVKSGVNLKMLCDSTVPDGYINRKNSQARTVVKRMPINVPLPALFEIYGDVLNIAVPGKEPVVFSIKSKEATEAMKKFFDFFWNTNNRFF